MPVMSATEYDVATEQNALRGIGLTRRRQPTARGARYGAASVPMARDAAASAGGQRQTRAHSPGSHSPADRPANRQCREVASAAVAQEEEMAEEEEEDSDEEDMAPQLQP